MPTGVPSTIQVLDANLQSQPVGVITETNAGVVFNVAMSASAGSGGKDWSVNAPVPPLIGAAVFGGVSGYSSWVLLQTVPANYGACDRRILNNSASILLLALDDGVAGVGSLPSNNCLILLAANAAFSTERFKGRIRVFCSVSTAWVAILES